MNAARRIALVCVLVLGLCLAPPSGAAITPVTVIYVDVTATAGANNGTTWADAYTSLQDALAASVSGNELWVADGIYYPDVGAGLADNNRSLSFVIPEGVMVYGGFAGGETEFTQRDWQTNRTILSGDIEQNDTTDGAGLVLTYTGISGNNAYNVVRFTSTTNTAVLDGFYITGGAAMGSGCPGTACGGGILVQSPSNQMTTGPVIRNVWLSGNKAIDFGGGMAAYYATAMQMSDITLTGNYAYEGGGMSLTFFGRVNIENASVYSNTAYNGAGFAQGDHSELRLSNANIEGNNAQQYGGGLYNEFNSATGAAPTTVLTDVVFFQNVANSGGFTARGGGIAHIGGGSLTMTRVTLQENWAGYFGGGMHLANTTYGNHTSVMMTDVSFIGNHTGQTSGGLHISSGTLTAVRATFESNWIPAPTADGSLMCGGGVGMVDGSATFTDSTFISNTARYGGGIAREGGNLTVVNATFLSNTASFGGGGISTKASLGATTVVDTLFQGNIASNHGGGIYHPGGGMLISGSSFVRNRAGEYGGGLLFQAPLNMYNNRFLGNRAAWGGAASGWGAGAGLLENIVMVGNRATGSGGGLDPHLGDGSVLTVTAATIISNTAPTYGGMVSYGSGSTGLKPVYLRNSIVWANSPISDQVASGAATGKFSVDYSDVQGGWAGAGANNLDADPLVRIPANPGADLLWATADDYYGFMALLATSPAVDAGNSAYTTLAVDITGQPRIFGASVDMGAYEFDTNSLPPEANAGADQTSRPGALVTLDGSGSSDPDGELPLKYLWQQTSGTLVSLSTPHGITTTFNAPSGAGVLTFTLTVTDSVGLQSLPDEVVITVTNQAPVADAGPDQTVRPFASVTLDGSGSSDSDGDLPLVYYWEQTGGPEMTLSDSDAISPTFDATVSVGVVTFTLRVTDTYNLPSLTVDEVVITIANQAPLPDAGPDQTVGLGRLVTLDGSGSGDPDGDTPLQYLWEQTGGPAVALSDAEAASPTFSAPDVPAVLTFILTVVDSYGLVNAVPDEVVITVEPHRLCIPLVLR